MRLFFIVFGGNLCLTINVSNTCVTMIRGTCGCRVIGIFGCGFFSAGRHWTGQRDSVRLQRYEAELYRRTAGSARCAGGRLIKYATA